MQASARVPVCDAGFLCATIGGAVCGAVAGFWLPLPGRRAGLAQLLMPRASSMGRNFAQVSASSASGTDPSTTPQPA
jgi:hypothetical protein